MEEVIQKLSEIETTAQQIMDEAELQKQALAENLKKRIQDYDQTTEAESSARIAQIRKDLETSKESQLADLSQKTAHILAGLDDYYAKNHQKLAQEIFHKITKI